MIPDVYTPAEASAATGVPARRLEQLAAAGEVEHLNFGHGTTQRRVRFTADQLEQVLQHVTVHQQTDSQVVRLKDGRRMPARRRRSA